MSNYENAPATEMLATDCLTCGRALVDSASVTAGMGPTCRKRHGYNEIPEEKRKDANKLIHEAARKETGKTRIAEIATELKAMGFETLSTKIIERLMAPSVEISRQVVPFGKGRWLQEKNAYIVRAKYREDFNEDIKRLIDWRNRAPLRKDGKFDAWAIMPCQRRQLWRAIKRNFQGEFIMTPFGHSTVP